MFSFFVSYHILSPIIEHLTRDTHTLFKIETNKTGTTKSPPIRENHLQIVFKTIFLLRCACFDKKKTILSTHRRNFTIVIFLYNVANKLQKFLCKCFIHIAQSLNVFIALQRNRTKLARLSNWLIDWLSNSCRKIVDFIRFFFSQPIQTNNSRQTNKPNNCTNHQIEWQIYIGKLKTVLVCFSIYKKNITISFFPKNQIYMHNNSCNHTKTYASIRTVIFAFLKLTEKRL